MKCWIVAEATLSGKNTSVEKLWFDAVNYMDVMTYAFATCKVSASGFQPVDSDDTLRGSHV